MTILNTNRFRIAMVPAAFLGLLTGYLSPVGADEDDFKPIVEADMPAGFPQVTPVGEVRIKRYPAYRKAQADASAGRAFWTLFGHIKKNDIAMTAPVEMTYADQQRPRERTMAFLYGSADLGLPGVDGRVEVVDVPATSVVSTGVRGPRTAQSVDQARDRLNAWLDANGQRYVADGQLRAMGYNSPFVPRNRNFFEVEIPIRELDVPGSPEDDE